MLNTDNRGGCELKFGVLDESDEQILRGLSIRYSWGPEAGADPTQCLKTADRKRIPTLYEYDPTRFAGVVDVDTDGRAGWCNLTFAIVGRSDISLWVKFYPSGEPAQCRGWTPETQPREVTIDTPQTFGIDTDNRVGGCYLSFALRGR
jgi:hypothetical protein